MKEGEAVAASGFVGSGRLPSCSSSSARNRRRPTCWAQMDLPSITVWNRWLGEAAARSRPELTAWEVILLRRCTAGRQRIRTMIQVFGNHTVALGGAV
jgi:hypothetical protein